MITYTLTCIACGRRQEIRSAEPNVVVPPGWKHIDGGYVCEHHDIRVQIVDRAP